MRFGFDALAAEAFANIDAATHRPATARTGAESRLIRLNYRRTNAMVRELDSR
jgi:hypothetical protein